jgi:flagellin
MEIQKASDGAHFVAGTKRAQGALRKTSQQLGKILEQLSTAKKINRASDDAAGLGVAEQLTTQIRGFKQASQNIADASAALDIADGAGREISDMLQRQRELAVAARNGTLSANDRQALDKEYQALAREISRTTEVTNYNRQQVANNTDLASGNAQIQVGPNAGETLNLPSVNFNVVGTGLEGTSLLTSDAARTALSRVDTAINAIGSQRSDIGATINRLTSAGDNLAVAMINTQAAESVIRDEDMAEGLAALTRDRILQEGAIITFQRYAEITRNHILGLLQ